MRLIDDEDDRSRASGKALPHPHNSLEQPIILLFNPNISERTIKSIGHIAESEN